MWAMLLSVPLRLSHSESDTGSPESVARVSGVMNFSRLGHDDGYAQALFAQQTHQLGGFVRRDAAADA